MKKTLVTVAFLTMSSLSYALAPIIGGENVPAEDAKGVLNILMTDENGDISKSCSASKIGAKFILTAAHCVHGKDVTAIGWSNSGTFDLEDETTPIYGLHIKKVNIHPSYDLFKMLGQTFKSSDFAILEVDTTKGNYLENFLDLPSLELDFSPVVSAEKLQVYGYGCEKTGDLANPLSHKKVATIETLPYTTLNTSCSAVAPVITQFANAIYKAQMVSPTIASGATSSLCDGDSGGPVLRSGKVVGVNSQYLIDQTSQTEEAYLNLHSRVSEVKEWFDGIVK